MKRIKVNRKLLAFALLLVTAMLFIFGHHNEAGGLMTANAAVVSLTDAEKAEFNEGEQKVLLALKKHAIQLKEQLLTGAISKDELTAAMNAVRGEIKSDAGKTWQEEFKRLEDIAKQQGTSLQEMGLKMNNVETGGKSIAQVMEENKDEFAKIYNQRSGTKDFMVQVNHKGEFVMKPIDMTKAAGPHGTIANTGGSTQAASIAQSIDAATLLRLGGDSAIISQYRNTPWVFDLCNLVNAGIEMPFAMWYEEQVKAGGSSTVVEGATKPKTQYSYSLKTSTYKKEATLIGFTDEFSIDFPRLQSDILGKGRTDLINNINSTVLANIISAATAYNTSASFKGTDGIAMVNDFDVLAALAAQADSATFGSMSNAAVMSTFKKYRMGIEKSSQGEYLDRPSVLGNLAFVGNPSMADDAVMVGDFKQYNIILRGGLIVRVGYNGTDFANNMFSTVIEQYYFDYISTIRAAAIVSAPDFATVKAAIQATI